MADNKLYAPGYKTEPYWWEAAPLKPLPQVTLPAEADIVVVGSGYSGLAAALVTARGGRPTLVLEAQAAGQGCSTRNGGQVSTSIKPGYGDLSAKHSPDKALAIRKEGFNALAFVEALIRDEGIDADWEKVGRFQGAHNDKQFAAMVSGLKDQKAGIEVPYTVVPREQQRSEIGTDFYHGGVVYPHHASLHPGKFHAGLLDRVQKAGATVADRTPVTKVERDGAGFRVTTARGTVKAKDVLIATNGYTGGESPWLRRRVIPIGSYIIATEKLDPALAKKLVPNNRVLSDSRKLVFYYRLSPDRRSVLFGGRVAANETDVNVSAPRLHAEMCRIWPELNGTKITHSWMGTVAYTFDTMPHLGKGPDGLWYCMGYCGSGVSLAPYFGTRVGQQMLGLPEGRTAIDDLAFPTRPLYTGTPWFLPMAVRWYRLRDRLPL